MQSWPYAGAPLLQKLLEWTWQKMRKMNKNQKIEETQTEGRGSGRGQRGTWATWRKVERCWSSRGTGEERENREEKGRDVTGLVQEHVDGGGRMTGDILGDCWCKRKALTFQRPRDGQGCGLNVNPGDAGGPG